VGLIARALEARGLPTLSMSVLWEASESIKPPRTCFLDFPLGCPAGKPHQAVQQREILRAALELAPQFEPRHWQMKTLPFQWSLDGSRAWEKEVHDLYRSGGIKTVLAHQQAHRVHGESLEGREREFVIKCNC
jgi:D-proline reductase (dithiol) PrdB